MAGETIKEVVIKIRTEVSESKVKAPDMSALTSAVEAAAKKAQTLYQSSYSAVNQAAQRSSTARNKSDEDWERGVDKRLKAIVDKHEKAERDRIRATEKAAKAFEQAGIKQEAANSRVISSMRSLGEAVTLAVRGFALLGADSNKDVQKLMNTLMMAQGAIDVYKGLTGVVLGLSNAHRALAASAAASAAAQAASGAAGGGGAGAGAAAGLSMGAKFSLGAAAVGLGAAIGYGLNYGINRFIGGDKEGMNRTDRAEDDRQNANIAADSARDQADITRRRQSRLFGQAQSREGAAAGAQFGLDSRQRSFGVSQAEADFGDARRNVGYARTQAERNAALSGQFSADRAARGALRGTDTDLAGQQAFYTGQRNAAQQQLATVEAGRGKAGSTTGFAEAQKAALEAQRDAEQKIGETLAKRAQLREQEVARQRESVSLAKDALQAEKDRVSGIQATLGRMDPGLQGEIKRINKKVAAGGTASEEDLRFLEEQGGGAFSDFTNQQRKKMGAAAFGDDLSGVSALTGGGSQTAQIQKELSQLIKGSGDAPGVPKLLEELTEMRKKEAEQIKRIEASSKALDGVVDVLARIADAQEALAKQIARFQAKINRS